MKTKATLNQLEIESCIAHYFECKKEVVVDKVNVVFTVSPNSVQPDIIAEVTVDGEPIG